MALNKAFTSYGTFRSFLSLSKVVLEKRQASWFDMHIDERLALRLSKGLSVKIFSLCGAPAALLQLSEEALAIPNLSVVVSLRLKGNLV